MSGSESRIADLLAGLQHLGVEANEPFCWRITVSSLPWSSTHCDTERERFLATLLKRYPFALWSSDAIKDATSGEVSWSTNEGMPPGLSENSYLGDWVLLLFSKETVPAVGMLKDIGRSPIKCGRALQLLEATGADLLVYSMPDDLEWLIAQRDYA